MTSPLSRKQRRIMLDIIVKSKIKVKRTWLTLSLNNSNCSFPITAHFCSHQHSRTQTDHFPKLLISTYANITNITTVEEGNGCLRMTPKSSKTPTPEQTSWTGVILMGKMTFMRAMCFAKFVYINGDRCP